MLKVGDKLHVSDSIGDVIILDVKKDYSILFRLDIGQFVKVNKYYYENGKLTWDHGSYFNSMDDLVKSIIKGDN